jgi:hypothetical protein
MGLEKNSDYSKTSLEGLVNCMKVDSMKNVLESLMEHSIMHGIDVDADKARLVVSLYTKHAQINDLTKVNLFCKGLVRYSELSQPWPL